jgi:hypothetical protein
MTMELIRPEVGTPSMPIDEDELLLIRKDCLVSKIGDLSKALSDVHAAWHERVDELAEINQEIAQRGLGARALARLKMVNIQPELDGSQD